MESKDIVSTGSSSSNTTTSKLNAEYMSEALARILVQISKGGPPPLGHFVHNIYKVVAEASNLKELFSPIASEGTPEPEPSSLNMSDIALLVKPTRMIRFCPNSQGENPRSKTNVKPQSSTNPLNTQQTATPTATHPEDVSAISSKTPVPEASPSPILVPFADMPTVSPSGSAELIHSKPFGSEKKRTLILNDDSEFGSDIVPFASLRKNPSASSSKSGSRKKSRTEPSPESASGPTSRTRNARQPSTTPPRCQQSMTARTYCHIHLYTKVANRWDITSARSFILQKNIDTAHFNSLCNVVELL